ncbi:MAG TPA: hypothetical protein VM554_08650 [Acidisarcina sp.]|nr:hypothetical protein [Acidisarcina sp.]
MSGKKNLSEAVFNSLDAMMLAYADEAVRMAAKHGEKLDFSSESIASLERCLTAVAAPAEPSADLEHESRIWGAYLGEVVRRRYGGDWQMNQYPGGDLAVPSLEIRGSHLYPVMKAYRRLTLGTAENVSDFYNMVAKRLGPPAPIH